MLPDILEICHFLFCLKICLANETNHRSIHFRRIAKITAKWNPKVQNFRKRQSLSKTNFSLNLIYSIEEATSVNAIYVETELSKIILGLLRIKGTVAPV
jgi:hypothetical protein